jgi:hypothetical protein
VNRTDVEVLSNRRCSCLPHVVDVPPERVGQAGRVAHEFVAVVVICALLSSSPFFYLETIAECDDLFQWAGLTSVSPQFIHPSCSSINNNTNTSSSGLPPLEIWGCLSYLLGAVHRNNAQNTPHRLTTSVGRPPRYPRWRWELRGAEAGLWEVLPGSRDGGWNSILKGSEVPQVRPPFLSIIKNHPPRAVRLHRARQCGLEQRESGASPIMAGFKDRGMVEVVDWRTPELP